MASSCETLSKPLDVQASDSSISAPPHPLAQSNLQSTDLVLDFNINKVSYVAKQTHTHTHIHTRC